MLLKLLSWQLHDLYFKQNVIYTFNCLKNLLVFYFKCRWIRRTIVGCLTKNTPIFQNTKFDNFDWNILRLYLIFKTFNIFSSSYKRNIAICMHLWVEIITKYIRKKLVSILENRFIQTANDVITIGCRVFFRYLFFVFANIISLNI